MRLVNYRCEECGCDYEDLERDECLFPASCECGGNLVAFNFKNNAQRVRIFDKELDNGSD